MTIDPKTTDEKYVEALTTLSIIIRLIMEEEWLMNLLKKRGYFSDVSHCFIWVLNPEDPICYSIDPILMTVRTFKGSQKPNAGDLVKNGDEINNLIEDIVSFVEDKRYSNYLGIINFCPTKHRPGKSFSLS